MNFDFWQKQVELPVTSFLFFVTIMSHGFYIAIATVIAAICSFFFLRVILLLINFVLLYHYIIYIIRLNTNMCIKRKVIN